MHVPEKWNMGSLAKQQFIDDFGFATLISKDLEASHLPLLLDTTVGEYGTLYGHFARATPHWKTIVGQSAVVIFTGPHAIPVIPQDVYFQWELKVV
ncbi:MAG: transcriptional regulator [Shewanella sp.]|jgi:transcriptional regulator